MALIADGATKGIATSSWTITTTKLPILSGQQSDEQVPPSPAVPALTTASNRATATLHLPLPEICFGNNSLKLQNESLGVSFAWETIPALKVVSSESTVKVAHAEEWARGQAASGSADVAVQKPFDWTYTTLYPGSITTPSSSDATSSASSKSFEAAPPSHPGIPFHLLARQDIPILFFDEVPLFEDELGDNGIAELSVRVRVNATSFFVLSRFFLRIDHVLFRIYDVRIYHAFGSSEVIREIKGRQASYEQLKKRLPSEKPDDLTPLADLNWVAANLEALATTDAGRSSRPIPLDTLSLQPPLPKWEGEGKVLEVMRV